MISFFPVNFDKYILTTKKLRKISFVKTLIFESSGTIFLFSLFLGCELLPNPRLPQLTLYCKLSFNLVE